MKKLTSSVIAVLVLTAAAIAGAAYYQRPFSHRMAAYVTDLAPRSEAQRENILRASAYLNGKVLHPQKTFSLNQTAGPYSEDRGFLPERSIRGKVLTQSSGGGVCQLGSTLYNTARGAQLEIIERVQHSQAVRSVPRGLDATLAYGIADLKFRNPHPYPIKIVARRLRDQLLVEIWGKEASHGNIN